jgi:peptidoglycan hydrolase CwlO-like protein
MVYVEGRGFRMGLALGAARENDKRAQQYDEDRLRAIAEHLDDRARKLADYERELKEHADALQEHAADRAHMLAGEQQAASEVQAQGEMNQLELGQTEQDALQRRARKAASAPGSKARRRRTRTRSGPTSSAWVTSPSG